MQSLSEFVRWMFPGDLGAPVRLAVLLAAVAIGCLGFVLADLAVKGAAWWRRRFISEAESELQEMFLAMPATTFLNYSLIAAGVFGLAVGALAATATERFHPGIGLFFALLAFGAVLYASRMLLRFLRHQRLERFNDQLEDALMSMSNSLKAGFSILQSIDMVVRQGHNPIAIEFRMMQQQVQLGMSLDEAMRTMGQRIQSEDFDLVVSAVSTARLTGGDLTGIFERLAALIRERLRIQRRVRTLTAMGRLQGLVLTLVPVGLFLALWLIDATLLRQFFSSPSGIAMFVVVLVLELLGFLVIRKIVNIDI